MTLRSSIASLGSSASRSSCASAVALVLELGSSRLAAIARISASVAGIGDQRLEVGELRHGGPIGLDLVDHRPELGEFARQRHELVGRKLAGELAPRPWRGGRAARRAWLPAGRSRAIQTGRPSASAKAASLSRIDAAPSGLAIKRAQQLLRLAGVELEQHRLDRADRRRRQRQRAVAEPDQRQRPERLRRQLAAQRHRLAVRAALVDDRLAARAAPAPTADRSGRRRADCRGRRRTGTASGRWSRPTGNRPRSSSSSSWNSSDGTSTMAPTSTRSGSLWPCRRRCVSSRSTSALASSNSSTVGDHREHDPQLAAAGGAQQRAHLAAQQARPVEAEADRAPAERRVLLLDVAHVGQHLVAADVERAEGHRLVAGGVEHRAIERQLLAGARKLRRHHELQFGAEQADAGGAGLGECGRSTSRPALIISVDGSPSLVTHGLSRSARYCSWRRARSLHASRHRRPRCRRSAARARRRSRRRR